MSRSAHDRQYPRRLNPVGANARSRLGAASQAQATSDSGNRNPTFAVEDNGAMPPLHVQLQNSTLRAVLRRLHFPLEVDTLQGIHRRQKEGNHAIVR